MSSSVDNGMYKTVIISNWVKNLHLYVKQTGPTEAAVCCSSVELGIFPCYFVTMTEIMHTIAQITLKIPAPT